MSINLKLDKQFHLPFIKMISIKNVHVVNNSFKIVTIPHLQHSNPYCNWECTQNTCYVVRLIWQIFFSK